MAIGTVKLLPNGVVSKASYLDPVVDDLTALDSRTTTVESRATSLEGPPWTPVPLSSGWVAAATTPSVRKLGPTNVQFVGTFTPGTKVDGTQIGTLPAGFRPARDMDVLATAGATVSGGQSPHYQLVAATGAINCWGLANATGVGSAGVNTIFPTNL